MSIQKLYFGKDDAETDFTGSGLLVLQPHLVSQTNCSPFDMGAFGSGLMSPAPV